MQYPFAKLLTQADCDTVLADLTVQLHSLPPQEPELDMSPEQVVAGREAARVRAVEKLNRCREELDRYRSAIVWPPSTNSSTGLEAFDRYRSTILRNDIHRQLDEAEAEVEALTSTPAKDFLRIVAANQAAALKQLIQEVTAFRASCPV